MNAPRRRTSCAIRRAERRPAILAVDDEPAVLAAVARDLRRGFGERYRILRARLGRRGARAARASCAARGDQVALLIADQRMPGMPGTDYLVEARTLVPDAKRVLLTAYADTEAAIAAINEVALDYYLLKPWDPPEEQLFPVVEDLLTTWESGAALEAGGVRVIGHRFSKDSHDLRDFLARNRVPARWLDVERDGEARELLHVAGVADDRLPVALLEDGTVLERPTVLELAERLGVAGQPAADHYDLVIVGGGPAGLAAAVYGASEGLRTVMVEREAPGGQAGPVEPDRELPRLPGRASAARTSRAARTDQARRLGAELLTRPGRRRRCASRAPGRFVELSGGGDAQRQLRARRLRRLLPPARRAGLRRAHRRRHLLRRGDDRGALVRATSTSWSSAAPTRPARRPCTSAGYAARVTMLVRGDSLEKSMSHYLIEQLAGAAERRGAHRHARRSRPRATTAACARLRVRDADGGEEIARRRRLLRLHRRRAAHRLARRRRRARRARLHPRRPRRPGRRLAAASATPTCSRRRVPGVFVAGDVRARSIKRVASAVGEGSMAVSLIHQYLVDG